MIGLKKNIPGLFGFLSVFLIVSVFDGTGRDRRHETVNSLGMRLIRIEAGSFMMGESNPTPEILGGPEYQKDGDWDEHPVHRVRISHAFAMSETEVTIDQFRQFRPEYKGLAEYAPYAAGVSWYDAVAFCRWLSEKEGKPYRLPTEAEWEYACRAGTGSLFSSGDSMPPPGAPNGWGLKNMHTGVLEWCLDWHNGYPAEEEKDPVGPSSGFVKVVRGGGLDRQDPYYARSANRAGMAPDFPPSGMQAVQKRVEAEWGDIQKHPFVLNKATGVNARENYPDFVRDVLGNQGNHPIGFRVVQAAMPATRPLYVERIMVQECVKQSCPLVAKGPDPNIPYFRKRKLLPIPPDNVPEEDLSAIPATGLHPALLSHNHSPSLEACPNGDLIAVYYTSISETAPDVALMALRLRFGADDWDMPDLFLDFQDVDDHAPLLWNDSGMLYLFWGANKLKSGFPFQWIWSTDNGATWSEVRFPLFETPVGPHSAQPINTAFRSPDGTIHVASDGDGPESVLWISRNNGESWIDFGGRTGGRHTTFVLLKDGRILGMGGKSTDIDGFMPKSLSSDGGKSWKIGKTPFPSLGSNQRPSILRLASGRLFFACDYQRIDGFQPEGISRRGVCVAYSEDEGESWHMKALPGAQGHEDPERFERMKGTTLGYSAARVGPNGHIHLITSMNDPCLHFEFNEAWLLLPERPESEEPTNPEPVLPSVSRVRAFDETFPDGKVRARWNAGLTEDGRVLLDGLETWFYESGRKQWEVRYDRGRKTGMEKYMSPAGRLLWSREYMPDNSFRWIRFWPEGGKKSESFWTNGQCEGTVTDWDRKGHAIGSFQFKNGRWIR